ncbi:MAG: bifunctional precorrin-2 dehydrogenase/sirohydrochlorin ferrochelatase [Methanoregula sp.]|jgi:precorrin-2 dehydrogenase/sirohydrochlorin ferrochelatase
MIPLFVDCSKKRVVIFGGGDVAARKAGHFTGQAELVMASRSFSDACKALPARFIALDTRTSPDSALEKLVTSAFLVIAALSDRDENDRIGKIAGRRGILFNNADGEPGDVVIPAISAGKNYTFAVTTGGESPAVARFVRQKVETDLPTLDAMIELQHKAREALRGRTTEQAGRREVLREILDDKKVWELLGQSPGLAWEYVNGRYLA